MLTLAIPCISAAGTLRHTVAVAALLLTVGCSSGGSPEAPMTNTAADPSAAPPPKPALVPAPPHVAELRGYLYADWTVKAKEVADVLLLEHPDDPWVLADAGFVFALSKQPEGEPMLARALELATAPNLRAEIRYYQALLLQRKDGLSAGRDAVMASLEEFPLLVAQRNLALIDGIETALPEDFAAAKAVCDRSAKLRSEPKEHRTCAAIRVGGTLWAVETWVLRSSIFIRAFYGWHLIDPRIPEGLLFDDDLDTEPDEGLAPCRDEEVLGIDQPHGLAGGVDSAEIVRVGSEEYLKFSCKTVYVRVGGDALKVEGPSTYTRICSLESGWCTGRHYTHEVKWDGTVIDRTVEIVDGTIVITPTGGAPETSVLP